MIIFSQCNQNKEISEKQQIDLTIHNDNWVLSEWVAESISIFISSEKPITLDFDQQNKKLSGNAGCNQYFGNNRLEENQLKVGQIGRKKMK